MTDQRPVPTYRHDGLRTPFDAAIRKGAEARAAGAPRSANPYELKVTNYHNGVTFSRAWHDAWNRGYDGTGAI